MPGFEAQITNTSQPYGDLGEQSRLQQFSAEHPLVRRVLSVAAGVGLLATTVGCGSSNGDGQISPSTSPRTTTESTVATTEAPTEPPLTEAPETSVSLPQDKVDNLIDNGMDDATVEEIDKRLNRIFNNDKLHDELVVTNPPTPAQVQNMVKSICTANQMAFDSGDPTLADAFHLPNLGTDNEFARTAVTDMMEILGEKDENPGLKLECEITAPHDIKTVFGLHSDVLADKIADSPDNVWRSPVRGKKGGYNYAGVHMYKAIDYPDGTKKVYDDNDRVVVPVWDEVVDEEGNTHQVWGIYGAFSKKETGQDVVSIFNDYLPEDD